MKEESPNQRIHSSNKEWNKDNRARVTETENANDNVVVESCSTHKQSSVIQVEGEYQGKKFILLYKTASSH